MEYIMGHELPHLIARNHGYRIKRVTDRHLADWAVRDGELNGAFEAAKDWSENNVD
ncbi:MULTISPECIES: hypothetical protein [Corynebacterium]|uniref:hypothetical protein n=1 Tax=Corynebacterium TaxID=1716 RepID=UPI00350FF88A